MKGPDMTLDTIRLRWTGYGYAFATERHHYLINRRNAPARWDIAIIDRVEKDRDPEHLYGGTLNVVRALIAEHAGGYTAEGR